MESLHFLKVSSSKVRQNSAFELQSICKPWKIILVGTTILVVVLTTVVIHLYSNSNEENKTYQKHETRTSIPASVFISLDKIESQTSMTSDTSEKFNLAYSAILDSSGSPTTKSVDNSDSSQVEANLYPIPDMDSGTATKHNSNF